MDKQSPEEVKIDSIELIIKLDRSDNILLILFSVGFTPSALQRFLCYF